MQDFHLRLLVVDDEADALFLLDHQLRRLGCATFTVASAGEARRCLAAQPFDLILCDLDLPGESGLDLLRWVRAQALTCEMILLTARPSVATAIQALRAGAADYLTRPVTPDDLAPALQRVADRLRQRPQREPALPATAELPPLPTAGQYHIGPVLLDLDRFVVTVHGRSVAATPTEIEILHCLCRHPDRVVSPQELVQCLRGYHVEPHQAPEIIRPHISNLRRKLLAAALEADVVRTVRGVGYILREPIRE